MLACLCVSFLSLEQVPVLVKQRPKATTNRGWMGGGGINAASGLNQSVFFYLQIPHFIANTDAVIYSGVRFQLDHKHKFYDSSLT